MAKQGKTQEINVTDAPVKAPSMAPQSISDLQGLAQMGDEHAKACMAKAHAGEIDLEKALPDLARGAVTMEDLAKGGCGDKYAKGEGPGSMGGPSGQDKANGGDKASCGAPGSTLSKMEDEEDDEDKELAGKKKDDEEDEEKGKSISQGDLLKALDTMDAIASGEALDVNVDRRAELGERLASGQLEKGERDEILSLLGSDDDGYGEGYEDVEKSFQELAMDDPDVQAGHVDADGFDISGYLGRTSAFVGGALDMIRDEVTKSLNRVHEFNKAQSQVLRGMVKSMEDGGLVKGFQDGGSQLEQRLSAIENQPGGRRSAPSARALENGFEDVSKSMGAEGDMTMGLSRDDVVKGLTLVGDQARLTGNGSKAPCGEDILFSTTEFETHNHISKGMLKDVKNALSK